MKPYAESCDQNRERILEVISPLLADYHHVLEIGSGTGQHAVYFAAEMPHLTWQPSDLEENHAGILAWLLDAGLDNVLPPVRLDTREESWPDVPADCVFSANTAHIMDSYSVEAMFHGVGALLPKGGLFFLYGPFNYHGRYTSQSNARFDQWLKQSDPRSGIKDFETMDEWARKANMSLKHDFPMPANNRILCWKR